jgi:hypothetical protein
MASCKAAGGGGYALIQDIIKVFLASEHKVTTLFRKACNLDEI